MENGLRYYLKVVEDLIEEGKLVPTYIVTAIKLPTGAIELTVNTTAIVDKISYILEAYDEDMCLKTNPDIVMQNIMVV